MSDSPSLLALAREAEEEALRVLRRTCEDFGAWKCGRIAADEMPELEETWSAFRAAQRAHREALVEATLRWREESGYLFRVRNGALEYLDPNDRSYYAGAWGRFSPAIHLIAIEANRD